MITLLHQLGLMLLGGVFVWAGAGHFFVFRQVAASMAARGLPASGPLLAAGSLLQISAGALLAFGIATPWAAAALAAFTVVATLMMLDFWRHEGSEREALRNGFLINIAVLGGLIVAATA